MVKRVLNFVTLCIQVSKTYILSANNKTTLGNRSEHLFLCVTDIIIPKQLALKPGDNRESMVRSRVVSIVQKQYHYYSSKFTVLLPEQEKNVI